MLDHVSVPVRDLERAAIFYDAVLAALGMARRKELPHAVGYGPATQPSAIFWILRRRERGFATPGLGLHVSFRAPTRAAVDAFHDIGMKAGGTDAGAPGVRPEYTQPFYGAFLLDLDGIKIEAVCRTAAATRGDAAP